MGVLFKDRTRGCGKDLSGIRPVACRPESNITGSVRPNRQLGGWLALAIGGGLIAVTLLVFVVNSGLPDARAIRAIGENARVTTIFDAQDRALFPVYKEERLDVTLDQVS